MSRMGSRTLCIPLLPLMQREREMEFNTHAWNDPTSGRALTNERFSGQPDPIRLVRTYVRTYASRRAHACTSYVVVLRVLAAAVGPIWRGERAQLAKLPVCLSVCLTGWILPNVYSQWNSS